MGRPTKREFEVRLEAAGDNGAWTVLKVPFRVEEAFGSRARVAVRGAINGFAFRSSLFPSGDGAHVMMVNKAMQKGAGVGPGDVVRVTMEPDTEPRAVEVPPELAAALAAHPAAKAAFDKLSPSHRREYADHVRQAKQAATRVRRAAKAVAMLAEAKPLKS
jgi:hypothetical protein